MNTIPEDVAFFLEKKSFLIISTIDGAGYPHCSCKGLLKVSGDEIYLIDLYRGDTYRNLIRNSSISASAVDEHLYQGFCLQGEGRIINQDEMEDSDFTDWRTRRIARTASRVIKNIQGHEGAKAHPEANFPEPKHLIVLKVKNIVDLARYERSK